MNFENAVAQKGQLEGTAAKDCLYVIADHLFSTQKPEALSDDGKQRQGRFFTGTSEFTIPCQKENRAEIRSQS